MGDYGISGAFGSTKRAMIGSGRKKILVVDSSKFDQTAFSVAGSMKEVDIIVTDKEPTERWKKRFEKFNVKMPISCLTKKIGV